MDRIQKASKQAESSRDGPTASHSPAGVRRCRARTDVGAGLRWSPGV